MSDDFDFDDDPLLADSTFLREVDNIAALAVSQPPVQRAAPGRSTSLLNTNSSASKGWTGPQRSVSSSSTFAPFSRNVPPGPHRPTALSSSRSISTSRPALARVPPVSAHAPSDEFDDLPLPLPADQLSAIDSIPSRPVARPPSIPSSRLGRTSSGSNSIGFQTHLNFRKENQTTKGKRWDRTAFAESGRRIGAVKGKKQAKGENKRGFDDEDEEDTEDEGDAGAPLVPYPKPLVDPSECADTVTGRDKTRAIGQCSLLMPFRQTLRIAVAPAQLGDDEDVYIPHQPAEAGLPVRHRAGVFHGQLLGRIADWSRQDVCCRSGHAEL